MIINLRVDKVTEPHVSCTLFMNGANCGTLILKMGEYRLFAAIISLGAKQVGQFTVTNKSDDSVFIDWIAKENTFKKDIEGGL